MKLSDQLRLLLELEDRISAIERIVFRSSSEGPEEEKKPQPKRKEEKKPTKKKPTTVKVSEDVVDQMSMTELVQIAVQNGAFGATRALQRQDLKEMVLEYPWPLAVEDPLSDVRGTIYHFITKVQPSLRQTLRCSCDCVKVCPTAQVIDCWTSNKQKIEELTK